MPRPRKAERQPALQAEISPVAELVAFIDSDHPASDLISVPSEIVDAISECRSSGLRFTDKEVESLVKAIDSYEDPFCKTLDEPSHVAISSVILHSVSCGARHRGFVIIAASLHSKPEDDGPLTERQQILKLRLGQVLPWLLESIALSSETEQTRRWMSVLALELLTDCSNNAQLLMRSENHKWLDLTKVLKDSKCELLRLLAGSIIRQMLFYGLPRDKFWATGGVTNLLDSFPVAEEQNAQWIRDFDTYVQVITTRFSLPERSNVCFALAASLTNKVFNAKVDLALFVTISSLLLTVFVQLPSGQQALQIDVPLENITNKTLVPAAGQQHKDSICKIQIKLSSATNVTCYVDGSPEFHKFVKLEFDSSEKASKMMRVLQPPSETIAHVQVNQTPPAIIQDSVENDLRQQIDLINVVAHTGTSNSHATLVATAAKATLLMNPMEQHLTLVSQSKFPNGAVPSPTEVPRVQVRLAESTRKEVNEEKLALKTQKNNRKEQVSPHKRQVLGPSQSQNVVKQDSKVSIHLKNIVDPEAVDNAILGKPQRKYSTKGKAFGQAANENQTAREKLSREAANDDADYDIPTSHPPSPEASPSPQRNSRPKGKKPIRSQKASNVTQEARAKEKLKKSHDAPLSVSDRSPQPRSRRAAALDADRKIRGIDTSDTSGQRDKTHIGPRKQTGLQQNRAAFPDVYHDSIEDSGGLEEATNKLNHAEADEIESTTEIKPSRARKVSSQGTSTVKKGIGVRISPPANIAHKSNKEVISPHMRHERLDNDESEAQNGNESLEVLMTGHEHPVIATEVFTASHISNVQQAERTESSVSKLEKRDRDRRRSGIQDPFTTRLGVAVAIEGSSKLGNKNGISPSTIDRNNLRKAPQEARHEPGRPLSLPEQIVLATPVLDTLGKELRRPSKVQKRKTMLQSGSSLMKKKMTPTGSARSHVASEKTPPLASGKTPIISFGILGPRNQGISIKSHTKKPYFQVSGPRYAISGNAMLGFDGAVAGANVPTGQGTVIEQQQQREQQQQQKPRPLQQKAVRGPALSRALSDDAEQVAFPDIENPPTVLQGPFHQPPPVEKVVLKASSQTTRVNHNGSPMPTHHLTNGHITKSSTGAVPKRRSQAKPDPRYQLEVSGDSPLASEDDELQPVLPQMNDVSEPSMPSVGAYAWINATKNKKQILSSPRAPSVISALPMHHIRQNGELVNTLTNGTIVTSNTQDPFIGQEEKLSHFSRLLRNVSGKGNKRPTDALTGDVLKKARLSPDTLFVDDPDKTLVEEPDEPHKRKPTTKVVVSNSSSITSEKISERAPSPTLTAHENANENETTPILWKKALQPHQTNTLDILTQITHRLLAHMIKSEDAFLDLLADFNKSGNLLIEHLAKEHAAENLARRASTEALRAEVMGLYRRVGEGLEGEVGRTKGRSKELEKRRSAHLERLRGKVEVALGRYGV